MLQDKVGKKDYEILIVDDEQDHLESTERGLRLSGFRNVTTERDSVRAAAEISQGRRFDLVLIDLVMPKMDGIELLEQIKKAQPATACIMFTAVHDIRKVVECMQKGAYDYLTKPVTLQDLLAVIERSLKTGEGVKRPLRILILEDDASSSRLMHLFLDPIGECRMVSNGRQALDTFERALKEGNPFDLLLLDILVPEINGVEVLKRIRDMEQAQGLTGSRKVKAVMTSGLSDAKNIEQAYLSVCDGYLVKPVNREKLLSVIRAVGLMP
jgi:CheY-like chemotaxis protein